MALRAECDPVFRIATIGAIRVALNECLYGAIPPPNLITVPSSVECTRGFNVDDDYVRLVLATHEGTRGVNRRIRNR